MSRTLLGTVLVGLAACGPAPSAGPGFDFELVIERGLLDQISAFQVSLVTTGSSLDCVAVQKSCLKGQVELNRFVLVKDAAGKDKHALVAPISLTAGTPNTQDVSLRDLPLGKDFAVVVEALSKDTPPRLAGSSCNYVKEITAGANQTVFAKIETLVPAVSCDPRVDP